MPIIVYEVDTMVFYFRLSVLNHRLAIRASAYPDRPGTPDCSSYFLAIVTPATVTITETISTTVTTVTIPTVTYTSPVAGQKRDIPLSFSSELKKRDITIVPSNIPSYASACSGSVRYESACSCIGVTRTITTLPTASVTVTKTSSLTSTVLLPTETVSPFYLQLTNISPGAYLRFTGYTLGFTYSKSAATLFYLESDHTFWAIGVGQATAYGDSGIDPFAIINFKSPTPLYCWINSSQGFGCNVDGYSVFGIFGGSYLAIWTAGFDFTQAGGQGPASLIAVPYA
ncbi:hypothetical protein TWF694_006661 [Orbilia ellipsospora]|uniref:Uncharacterized protein n=1 Tax=Orbilia ellipsospora TaxID=2528407 RepID=A0AAV9XSI3_9PEZI